MVEQSVPISGPRPVCVLSVQSNSTPKPVESAQLGVRARGGQKQKGHRHSTGSYRRGNEFRPLNSSPLARGSKFASAVSSGSWPSSPTSSPPVAALFERPRTVDADEDPRRAFLRVRFKKRYFVRATKAREKAVKAMRRKVEGSEDYFANDDDGGDSDDDGNRSRRKSKGKGKAISDDEDMDDDDEEGEGEILNDELFSRIVANMNRKTQHAYRVSYAREIGSSFNPDIEDISRWEDELRAEPVHRPFPASSSTSSTAFPSSSSSRNFPPSSSGTFSTPSSGTIRPDIRSSPPRAPTEYEYDGADEEDDFADFEDAEIEEYAEEYAWAHEQELEAQQQQGSAAGITDEDDILAGLEDIPEDELFREWNWSESEPEGSIGGGKVDEDEDEDMDCPRASNQNGQGGQRKS